MSSPPKQALGIAGPVCELCELVVGWFVDNMADNDTEAAILNLLESVCLQLPFVGEECEELVETYGPQIFEMLRSGMAANVVCSGLHLCFLEPAVLIKKPATSCDVCTFVTDQLLALVKVR